jgi:predicted DNA-binding protein
MPKTLRSDDDAAVLFVRGMPRDLLAKLKATAALRQMTLGDYIKELCEAHVQEMEKKGILPKGKG